MDGIQIAIEPGDAAWEQAAPLFAAVWPPELRATFSWAHVIWANAERRGMVRNGAGELVCHVGFYLRKAKWGDKTVKIGGIGGVITRQDSRRQGYASAAISIASAEMKADDADFGLLFCEPHNFGFYRGLGWGFGAGRPGCVGG